MLLSRDFIAGINVLCDLTELAIKTTINMSNTLNISTEDLLWFLMWLKFEVMNGKVSENDYRLYSDYSKNSLLTELVF